MSLSIEKSTAKRSSSILKKLCIFCVCIYEMMVEDATVEMGSLFSMVMIKSQSGRGQWQHNKTEKRGQVCCKGQQSQSSN